MALQRYAALLRGVSPTNAKMPELKRCFEGAGFADVATVLSSGNVVFSARSAPETALERKAEATMQATLGRSFPAIVRRLDALQAMLDADPFAAFRLDAARKRVVTFLRAPATATPALPLRLGKACIHAVDGDVAYVSYVPEPSGPVFMTLIEKTFGKQVTKRTWDTIAKIANHGAFR